MAAVQDSPTRAGDDLLALPLLGPALLRRRVWQVALLVLAGVLILHGLLGPQLAPKNLATLVVWVHYRGLLVAALLVAGNLLCLACPIMLLRDGLRRLVRPRLGWPAALRNKLPGTLLLVALLFVYEAADLWASPWATAWLMLGLFGLALLVDGLVRGASFCKWLCPVGQFNFVAAALAPLEVRARDQRVCDGCSGHECLTGRELPAASTPRPTLTQARLAPSLAEAVAGPSAPAATSAPPAASDRWQRGCELGLLIPGKRGNLDCTLCLDCVRACPEDNVVLATRLPGAELLDDGSGSGVGRRSRRLDLGLLASVFTFGALLNAFGMVSPVYAVQRELAAWLGTTSETAVLAVLFGVLLVVEPLLLLAAAAALSRPALPERPGLLAVALRFVHGLVPLGVAVWAAHYGFHLLTGLWTVVPVAQQAAREAFGVALLGSPAWGVGGLREGLVQVIELGLLGLGSLGSLGVLWGLARREAGERALAAFLPWAVLTALLTGAAVWLLEQPMEMRGTFLGG